MISIVFDKENNKSVAYDDSKKIGECVFVENKENWNIVHTEVKEDYKGQKIALKMVESVMKNAEKNKKTLVSDCSYAKKIIENN